MQRVRLAVRGLRHDAAFATRLERVLAAEAGIVNVRASPWSGSVVVRFGAPATAGGVQATIDRLVGLDSTSSMPPAPEPYGDNPRPPGRAVAAEPAACSGHGCDPVWHTASVEAVAAHFATSPEEGLSDDAAAAALARAGSNTVPEPPGPSRLGLLFDQVATFPVALLAASAVLSIATGGLADAIAIVTVVAINAAIGYVTERDAERTIRSLGRLDEGAVSVVRGGRVRQLAASEVVPGDLLKLLPGTAVAADARIAAVDNLTVDESPLTGESVPVVKTAETLSEERVTLGDRRNMAFKGTSVVSGQGRAIVVATGAATEIGRIERLAATAAPPQTSLQRQLDRMGRQLVWISLAACGLTFVLGLLRGYPWLAMVKSSISLAVAAVPEGLPTVATVTLALGIGEMRRHQAVVRKLQAVETLGSVTVVCFDKTGTLTENRMRAVGAVLPGEEFAEADVEGSIGANRWLGHPAGRRLLEVCALCTDAGVRRAENGDAAFSGTATEQALLRLAVKNGIDVEALRSRRPLLATEYRAPGHNYMLTRHCGECGEWLAVKGNPDDVLARCCTEARADAEIILTEQGRAAIAAANEALAARGFRVLGFASGASAETLSWLGLVGLADPIRPNLAALMRTFHGAGIRTVLITGDQSATAYAVARALDLSGTDSIEILEGLVLDGAEAEVIGSLAQRTHVFARVSPANKLAIVRALQGGGDAVAMTGDGINDGPALRAADIGVSLGSASHMAHQLADLVLADDRLETMAVAVREGRTIYRNIRKAIRFLLATNLSEILVMLAATGAAIGQPLTPAQLLWINIVSDIFPGLGLAVDPPDPDVLDVPPRPTDAPIFAPADFVTMGIEGAVISLGALAATLLGGGAIGGSAVTDSAGVPAGGGQSASSGREFLALTLGQLLHALAGRSETETVFAGRGRPPNRRLQLAVAGLIALQAGVLVVPGLRRLLGLQALRPTDLVIAGAAGLGSFAANQAIKKARAGLAPGHAAFPPAGSKAVPS